MKGVKEKEVERRWKGGRKEWRVIEEGKKTEREREGGRKGGRQRGRGGGRERERERERERCKTLLSS